MKKIFGFLIGAFVGGVLGAAVALLLAPESGENLRGKFRARSQGWLGEIQSAAASRRSQLESRWLELMG